MRAEHNDKGQALDLEKNSELKLRAPSFNIEDLKQWLVVPAGSGTRQLLVCMMRC